MYNIMPRRSRTTSSGLPASVERPHGGCLATERQADRRTGDVRQRTGGRPALDSGAADRRSTVDRRTGDARLHSLKRVTVERRTGGARYRIG
jgi:hypothetical protein